MANYNGFTRTNYFKVKDVERFKAIIDCCITSGDIDIWEENINNETLYGFGCFGSIYGLEIDDDENYNAFIDELQKVVADDDAIIITEVGYEKLRYLSADSCIITSKEVKSLDLNDISKREARAMLKNKEFNTQMSY